MFASNRRGKPEYTIHLRLRHVEDHSQLWDYQEIVETMAHELSHCVHRNHGPEFWNLTDEILEDHAKVVEDLKAGKKKTLHNDPFTTSEEQFSGFNIYQSSTGQVRH
jgi:predicted metal-dependent hydrolase